MEWKFHLGFPSWITFLYSNSITWQDSWQTQQVLLAHEQINTIPPVASAAAGSTRVIQRLCCLLRTVITLSCCHSCLEWWAELPSRKQRAFTATSSSRARLQGTMLRGPVSLPEPAASACRLLHMLWESNEKGQQTINHLSEHYLSAALK